jgi:uncharacterized protein (TIGR03000 family)
MFKTTLSFAKIAVLATAIVLMTYGESEAQRRGGGGGFRGGGARIGGGGFRGGGFGYGRGGFGYGRGFYGRGFGYGGWGGGYYPYYGGYWGGGYYPYYSGGYYPYYSGGYYPYYSDYYTPYSSYYTTPSYYYGTAPVTTVTPQGNQFYYPSDTANPASATDSNAALVEVVLPSPTAEVWFGDHKTSQLGAKRHFSTPPLTPGQNYTYQIRASWTVDGQPVTQTRTVSVTTGKTTVVNFTQ